MATGAADGLRGVADPCHRRADIGSAGLGRAINLARSGGNVDVTYALIVATGMLGWALNRLFAEVEQRALRWHPSQGLRRPA